MSGGHSAVCLNAGLRAECKRRGTMSAGRIRFGGCDDGGLLVGRLRLFEFEDLPWFPRPIRDGGMDFLRTMWELGKWHRPLIPVLRQALVKTESERIVDLGSGGGGPWLAMYGELAVSLPGIQVTLTDRYPNVRAFHVARERTRGGIDFSAEPVDATAVPAHLRGFRTMFFVMHHFSPVLLRAVLRDAVEQRCPIGFFDMTAFPTPPPLLLAALGNPVGIWLVTPFVRPFRWSRLLWTRLGVSG